MANYKLAEGGCFGGEEWLLAVVVIRHPDTGYPMVTLTIKSFPNDATVVADSVDQPGVLAYLTGLFDRLELSFDVCVGEPGLHGYGVRFEFPVGPKTHQQLRKLSQYVYDHPEEFHPRGLVDFDRVYELTIRVPQNGRGLMVQPTQYLADENINMRHVRAERNQIDAASGEPEVTITAELEVQGIGCEELETAIRNVCLQGSQVEIQPLWPERYQLPM